MRKLELGAGINPFPGYTHQDIRALPDIEIICDASNIWLFEFDLWDEIRACHLLEHFSYTETVYILKGWRSILYPGGKIHIEVPNFSWQTRAHTNGEITDEEAVYYIYGEQNYEENTHKAGFTEELLQANLIAAGFKDITIQDIGQVLVAEAYN
jgi:predicted SAM-dependent methyltransferase